MVDLPTLSLPLVDRQALCNVGSQFSYLTPHLSDQLFAQDLASKATGKLVDKNNPARHQSGRQSAFAIGNQNLGGGMAAVDRYKGNGLVGHSHNGYLFDLGN